MNRLSHKIRSMSYGWWVAIVGAANMTFVSAPTFQGSGVIFAAVEAQFGWSRTVVSGVATFGRFGGAVLGPLEGYLVDRLGPARMMLIGLVLGGIGFLLFSQTRTPTWYFATFFILSLGFSAGGFMPATAAVAKALPRRRATGIAIVLAGSSLGALLVPLLAWGIETHGFRTTMVVIGLVAIALAPAFSYALSRRPLEPRPDDAAAGQSRPGGAPEERAPDDESFTVREEIRTRAFWFMAGAHALANISVGAVSAHIVLHLKDLGMSLATASSIIPMYATIALVAQLTGGLIGDRMDKRVPIAGLMAVQTVAIVVLAYIDTFAGAVLFAVLWGIGFGARPPLFHAMRGDYFGGRYFASILGVSSFPMTLGMMAAPVVAGYAFDVQGTYRWVFLGVAACCLAGGFLILFATRPIHPRVARQAAAETRAAQATPLR